MKKSNIYRIRKNWIPITIILNTLNKGHACKKKNPNIFRELHLWNRRKTTESTYALYPVPGYFSTGLVVMKLNTHCYAVNKRTVILRNNKQDNALLLFLINFLHEHSVVS